MKRQFAPAFPPELHEPITQPPNPECMVLDPGGLLASSSGLEHLSTIDKLLIKQHVEACEIICGCETNNRYSVNNSTGQQIYCAYEETDCCTRNVCGSGRPFSMKLQDNIGREVLHLRRPFRSSSCLCPCFLQRIEVATPFGSIIGLVYQEWSILAPKFTVRDNQENVLFRIEGAICSCIFCGNVEFSVISALDERVVGNITKKWSGLLHEMFTDSDNFGITFPMDLDVRLKATLIGAAMLIDFMYFEDGANN